METLLLLHGAIGAADQLQPLADALRDSYDVHVLNFSGHGGKPFFDDAFTMNGFAGEVMGYMDAHRIERASIFGYSMGGYVAMCLAKSLPHRVNKIVTLATKYHWDEATAAREIKNLDPEKIAAKVPAFAAALQERHAPNDWKEVLQRTANMMVALGADNPLKMEDHAAIQTPVLILLGDRDTMVTLDETVAVYRALPNAQFGVLPGTPHPIEQVDVRMVSFLVKGFVG